MVIVVSLGAIITALTYLFGFIFVIYIIDNIIKSINELLMFLYIDFWQINSFHVVLFILLIISAVVILKANGDYEKHKNEKNEIVYRKDWQKILGLVNVVMIYPVFTFFKKNTSIDNTTKIFMIFYAIAFLIIFVLSHHYAFIKGQTSFFDKICFHTFQVIFVLASLLITALILSIYTFVIFLHDFKEINNIVISFLYYIFIILSTFVYSVLCFPRGFYIKKIKNIITNLIYVIFLSVILGFSSFYNLFIKNSSIYSVHTLILIDIGLIFFTTLILMPIRIIKSSNAT
jgi:hypothetical protein